MEHFTATERQNVKVLDFSFNLIQSRREFIADMDLNEWLVLREIYLLGNPLVCLEWSQTKMSIIDDCPGKIIFIISVTI